MTDFLAAVLSAVAQGPPPDDDGGPLCGCGWDGEPNTYHCAFCHKTADSRLPGWTHDHVTGPDGRTYPVPIRDTAAPKQEGDQ